MRGRQGDGHRQFQYGSEAQEGEEEQDKEERREARKE
jgi:hypothetical protein